MQAIVGYSGGIGSWAAGMRAVERYGRENVTLLFCDTNYEDADLYRFLHEGAAVIGVPVTTIADGRTPWQVFKDERFLGNHRVDPCSKILKRALADKWIKARHEPDACIRLVGMDYCQRESLRLKTLQSRMAPYRVESPLFWEPPLDKDMAKFWALSKGLAIPRLYALGFAHNNCGGRCVKAGISSWANLYRTMPDRFLQEAEKEKALGSYLGKNVSILEERRDGRTAPLTLYGLLDRLKTSPDFFQSDGEGDASCDCFA
jgi:hypothetical protein